jgi:hypothetical protein
MQHGIADTPILVCYYVFLYMALAMTTPVAQFITEHSQQKFPILKNGNLLYHRNV